MSNEHSPTDNIVYNMISVQYHALKAADVYHRYLEDCHGHEDVSAFILQCQAEDAARVQRAHNLIKSLMTGEAPAAGPAEAAADAPKETAPTNGEVTSAPVQEKVRRWR